ncbi:hypothetical protein MUA68_14620 (plasmid) [Staphylococcus aureus]|uniref:hypothetical protein n=1 Tax=Staphylococcus aureus TaxID=1280 RepID=UPI0021D2155D|nr:hypothetical protein [Staphylococcus aureus]UXV54406.1 hypothetical protein MUA78_14425 [Staphylococcus aureus]UXV57118.1 hypothetical protein MUA68_14620 [Staphylococcus aureus]
MREKSKQINELVNYFFESEILREGKKVNSRLTLIGLKEFKSSMALGHDYNATYFEKISFRHKNLVKFFRKMYKRLSHLCNSSEDDFTQYFACQFIEACNNLDILEDLNDLLANDFVFNQRMRFIKDEIERTLPVVLNPTTKAINLGTDHKNKKVVAFLDLKKFGASLNAPTKTNENTEIISLLGDDNKLYEAHDKNSTIYTHFIQWFLANKDSILTEKQLDMYNNLSYLYVPLTDGTKETKKLRAQMYEDMGFNNVDDPRQKMKRLMNNIRKRAIEKYQKEFGDNAFKYGFSYNYRIQERAVLNDLLQMIDNVEQFDDGSEDCDIMGNRQIAVSKYVREFYDVFEQFEIVITKGLTLDEKKEIVKTVLGKQLLSNVMIRKIKNNVQTYLKNNPSVDIKPAKQEFEGYTENLMTGVKDVIVQKRIELEKQQKENDSDDLKGKKLDMSNLFILFNVDSYGNVKIED